ncbi:anaerobic ribonucleoside-triphosphate reductase activating protein [Aquincola sp. S2]|uniref:Anaerobic ribonucleoside-triphosphate reductase activating protein n=1 Tax=Pseudaquabacterium terrae TaxID=2732868 RepID=A0ABX2ER56_9BURK|nr:anaerobic ribonucleoside-triphosphate reductase activating protein [Aquabacterium terrae]NRF71005.1 anaerobic ribonucleoside-triphosphate reductase activating protein [Aquabacterium terrae]
MASRQPPEPRPAQLKVGGLTPFTSIDYPGKLSAVVFVQGCPWRCVYCHNPHLQRREGGDEGRSWPDVLGLLKRRVGLVDAVVFSGGEPTIDPQLGTAMADVRALGFSVGLHTAGIYPRRLAEVLDRVDWIGFDVKAPLSEAALHDGIASVAGSSKAVAESLSMVLRSGVELECRTTAHPGVLSEADLLVLAQQLAALGVRRYALQIARAVPGSPHRPEPTTAAYPSTDTLSGLQRAFAHFSVRRS